MEEVSVPRLRGQLRRRPEAAQGRSGLRCRLDPALAHWQRHRVGDPGPQRPPRGPGRSPTLGNRRYHDRNTVERCVGHLRERRRLVVRHEKKASHSEATASSHDPLGIRRGIPESIIIRRSLVQRVALRLVHAEARPRDRRCGFRRHELKGDAPAKVPVGTGGRLPHRKKRSED